MGRADRRRHEKKQAEKQRMEKKQALQAYERDIQRDGCYDAHKATENDAYYKVIVEKTARKSAIVADDRSEAKKILKEQFDLGYNAARQDLSHHYMKHFYAGTAVALHDTFQFGQKRIARALEALNNVMSYSISSIDLLEECKHKTGITMFDEYINEWQE